MKLAILIVGKQNSGKTSTIKHLVNSYSRKSLSIMKRGYTSLFLNKKFRSLKLVVYCVPASPSETNIDLKIRFKNWDKIPQILIIAEQLRGSKYQNTIDFLNSNGYQINEYEINNVKGSQTWERFDSSNETKKLENRADEIIDYIKKHIRSNNII